MFAGGRNPQESDPQQKLSDDNTHVKAAMWDDPHSDQTHLKQIPRYPLQKLSDDNTHVKAVMLDDDHFDQTHLKQIPISSDGHRPAGVGSKVPYPSSQQNLKVSVNTPNNLNNRRSSSSGGLAKKKSRGLLEPRSKPDKIPEVGADNRVQEVGEAEGLENISATNRVPVQTEEGGVKNYGSKQNKQSRKGEKHKLKDSEQEEQLKLARSLIGNLERKVIELENSNKILRREALAGSTDLGVNGIKDNVGDFTHPSNKGSAHIEHDSCKVHATHPQSVMERDLQNIRESIRNVELEQLRSRVHNIELHILNQSRLNDVPPRGGLAYSQVQGPSYNQAYFQSCSPFLSNAHFQVPHIQPSVNCNPSHVMIGTPAGGGNVQWGMGGLPQMLYRQPPVQLPAPHGGQIRHSNFFPLYVPGPYGIHCRAQQPPGYGISGFQGPTLVHNEHFRNPVAAHQPSGRLQQVYPAAPVVIGRASKTDSSYISTNPSGDPTLPRTGDQDIEVSCEASTSQANTYSTRQEKQPTLWKARQMLNPCTEDQVLFPRAVLEEEERVRGSHNGSDEVDTMQVLQSGEDPSSHSHLQKSVVDGMPGLHTEEDLSPYSNSNYRKSEGAVLPGGHVGEDFNCHLNFQKLKAVATAGSHTAENNCPYPIPYKSKVDAMQGLHTGDDLYPHLNTLATKGGTDEHGRLRKASDGNASHIEPCIGDTMGASKPDSSSHTMKDGFINDGSNEQKPFLGSGRASETA
ncbi:MAG: hypothetical protein AB2693_22645 [Candidatus Thiodiazotropha sp.]